MITIELNRLSIHQSGFAPVIDLSMTVAQGECVALFGEKEADTVLALLSGFCKPSQGEGTVMGYDLTSQTAKIRRISSILPITDGISPRLSVKENIELFLRLGGKKKKEATERAMRLVAAFELIEKANAPAASLSKGQRTRLSMALAQANDPPLLLLNKPAKHLSSHEKREILDILVKRKGKSTIVFSTADPFVAAAFCDRIALFKDGKLAFFDRVQALLSKTETFSVEDAIAAILQQRQKEETL